MSSIGSNGNEDRPDSGGITGSVSVAEASRKRPFKSLSQDVVSSNTYSRGNNNIMGSSGSYGDQINESIPEVESMVRRMVSTATQNMQNRMDSLQTQIDELNKRNQQLEVKVKNLTLKTEYNGWLYSAEDIPASYWIERGFSEEYAENMVEFLRKMKEYTHQLRQGEPPATIMLNFMNDNKMLHDDILLPHWKELADALKQYQNFDYREDYGIGFFRFDYVQLQQEVLDMFAQVLKKIHIQGLGLGGNIGSDMVTFMSDIIQINPHIEKIGWRDQFLSADEMRQLCNSIKNGASSSFNCLAVDNSFDGNNLQMMQTILDVSHQLEILNLNNNGIGTVGSQLIANFLASNPTLGALCLKDNDLGDTDSTLLANALKSNTHLGRLDLNDNDITSVGRQALLETVFSVSSLNSCAASNHKCSIHGLTPEISDTNMYEHPSDNRAMKTFTILSATDEGFFNMNCLGDVSYKVIPNVLRLAQLFDGETPEFSDFYFEQTGQRSADWSQLNKDTVPITSMFELLRGWAVPSLS